MDRQESPPRWLVWATPSGEKISGINHLDVVQLAERRIWDAEAVSSSLIIQTNRYGLLSVV